MKAIKLKHGRVYTYAGTQYTNGTKNIVDDKTADHLLAQRNGRDVLIFEELKDETVVPPTSQSTPDKDVKTKEADEGTKSDTSNDIDEDTENKEAKVTPKKATRQRKQRNTVAI